MLKGKVAVEMKTGADIVKELTADKKKQEKKAVSVHKKLTRQLAVAKKKEDEAWKKLSQIGGKFKEEKTPPPSPDTLKEEHSKASGTIHTHVERKREKDAGGQRPAEACRTLRSRNQGYAHQSRGC